MRWAGVLLLLGTSGIIAQTGLPATGPTGAAGAVEATAAARTPVEHRAQVVYARGELKVTADDSSLNQILADIGRQTGMKISGSVSDERVYGSYGPGSPSDVLTSLLEGTGTNMVLLETPEHAPAELILTARMGGVTPPNPNARSYDEEPLPGPREPDSPQHNAAARAAAENAAGETAARTRRAGPNGTPAVGALAGSVSTMPGSTAQTPQTPQQVMEQLQRLQQQQSQQQTANQH